MNKQIIIDIIDGIVSVTKGVEINREEFLNILRTLVLEYRDKNNLPK